MRWHSVILVSLMCLSAPATVCAQKPPTDKSHLQEDIERYRAEMYRLYGTDSISLFMAATDRLKELTLEGGDEHTFYKTWCNQAVYIFRKKDRDQGLAMLKEIQDYAEKHDSKFGLYAATNSNSTMMSIQKHYDQAKESLYKCIDYLHRYFPDESAAVDYIALSNIYHNEKDFEKELDCAQSALKEKNIIPIHQQSAWAHTCIALAELIHDNAGKKRFNDAFAQWEQVDSAAKTKNGLTEIVRYYHAKVNGHPAEMLELAKQIPSKLNRYHFEAEALAANGRYEEAYRLFREFKAYNDSINVAEVQQESAQNALKLSVARAESEAKDLRIANQAMGQKMLAVLGVLTIVFLSFYLYRRRQQLNKLREAYDQLEETTKSKERIDSELRIARNIQMGMVPSKFPAFPDRDDIDLYGLMVPAKEVGGDFYDFFLQDNTLYLCLGDVSGKGVPASMMMSVAVNLFRTVAKSGVAPEQVATTLNETLSIDNHNGMFITMFIGKIDLQTGVMAYCNAGHTLPVLDNDFLKVNETNVPLGLWPEYSFIGERVEDISGKTLLIYSDGLNEAENVNQEQYGDDRLLNVMNTCKVQDASIRQTIEQIQQDLDRYVNGAQQSDDFTMLCVRIKKHHQSILKKELVIQNNTQELKQVNAFIEDICKELDIGGELLMNLQLVMEETLTNIIFYAHPEGCEADIQIVAESDGNELTFVISDQGMAFDPTEKNDFNVDLNPAEREIGGMGIFIVKNIMNKVTYQRVDGHNHLTLKKTIR